jgi:hypothetical protein
MTASYLISRKWTPGNRSVITDETGTERFEVQGPLAFSRRPAVCHHSRR